MKCVLEFVPAAVIGVFCAVGMCRAEGALNPTDPVAGHPSVTYFDLVRQIVPDLDSPPAQTLSQPAAPTAHTIVPYRHIEGENAKTDPAGPVAIQLLSRFEVRADGKPRLALLADLGPSDEAVAEFTLLALFDMTDRPKLLDVVEVGTDRFTGFAGKPLPLGHGSDLITIVSDHFNSNEDFVATELLFVRNDRFRLIGSIFTFNVRLCASRRTQSPAIATHADAGGGYHEIQVAVHEAVTREPDRTGCSGEKIPRPFKRTYQATYRWSKSRGKFEAIAGDLQKLDRENKKLTSGGL
jgi:hypothetical protein